MKIYNKKVFASGVFEMALGLLLLITSIVRQDLDIKSIILIVAFALKSKSKSFQLTQIISFMLMLALLVMGKVSGYEGFITMGVGLAFAFAISMFSELFTYMYYESKN